MNVHFSEPPVRAIISENVISLPPVSDVYFELGTRVRSAPVDVFKLSGSRGWPPPPFICPLSHSYLIRVTVCNRISFAAFSAILNES